MIARRLGRNCVVIQAVNDVNNMNGVNDDIDQIITKFIQVEREVDFNVAGLDRPHRNISITESFTRIEKLQQELKSCKK